MPLWENLYCLYCEKSIDSQNNKICKNLQKLSDQALFISGEIKGSWRSS